MSTQEHTKEHTKEKKSINKLLVIGVDGATFDVIKPLVEAGQLPNIARLIQNGVHGNLESTIPPITGPAWTTFQTGANPGKHGLFDWLVRGEDTYQLKPINSTFLKQPLWETVSQQGGEVGVINVPVTYPPREVNGVLVTGLLTPSTESDFTWPPDLKNEIEQKVPQYEINPGQRFEPTRVDAWLDGLHRMIVKRKELALHLMNTKPWDFFMVHFIATDTVQHRMWHKIKDDPTGNPVANIYKEVDKAAGEILAAMPDDTRVIMLSDHGFGPLHHNIYLNNWLVKHGYLKLKKNPGTLFKRLMYKLALTPANIYKIMGKFGLLNKGLQLGKEQRYSLVGKFFLSNRNIDWKKTKAYSYGNIGQIYINTLGREPGGSVAIGDKDAITAEIIAKLKETRNPYTKEPLFDHIYKKEELYKGEKLEDAPEILLLPRKLEAMAVGASEFVSNKIVEPSFAFTGGHRMEGIFIASGPGVNKNAGIKDSRIIDLLPTILYSMGLQVPKDSDGNVLDIFTPGLLEKEPPQYYDIEDTRGKTPDSPAFSHEEEEGVKNKLEDLGYVT